MLFYQSNLREQALVCTETSTKTFEEIPERLSQAELLMKEKTQARVIKSHINQPVLICILVKNEQVCSHATMRNSFVRTLRGLKFFSG